MNTEKRWRFGWTRCGCAFMVLLLCLGSLGSAETVTSDPAELTARLRETEMARQAAEQRCAELSLALVRTERELEKQRATNAGLLLKSQELQNGLDGLQLRVAPLLLGDSQESSGDALAAVLAGLQTRQADVQQLIGSVRGFSKYLPPVLDTLPVSGSLRQEIRERIAGMDRACDRVEALPPLVARRGGNQSAPTECRVWSVNPELGVIALDAGASSGMRPGTGWQVLDQGKAVARVRVIEVRPGLSAAQVLEGQISRLAPGMKARAAE